MDGQGDRSADIVDLLRIIIVARLCDSLRTIVEGSANDGITKIDVRKNASEMDGLLAWNVWLRALESIDMLHWMCRRPHVTKVFCDCCETRGSILVLIGLLRRAPLSSGALVFPVLSTLRTFICGVNPADKGCSRRGAEAIACGFFSAAARDLRGWTDAALSKTAGLREATRLLSCLGDLVRHLISIGGEGARKALISSEFVPALHDLIHDRLLSEPLLWPRSLMLLMDTIEAIPRSEYVRRGLELSKVLRRMRSALPSSDVNAIPSLLCLRMGELRRAAASEERQLKSPLFLQQRAQQRPSSWQSSRADSRRRQPCSRNGIGMRSDLPSLASARPATS